jgi:hypothetical protein
VCSCKTGTETVPMLVARFSCFRRDSVVTVHGPVRELGLLVQEFRPSRGGFLNPDDVRTERPKDQDDVEHENREAAA